MGAEYNSNLRVKVMRYLKTIILASVALAVCLSNAVAKKTLSEDTINSIVIQYEAAAKELDFAKLAKMFVDEDMISLKNRMTDKSYTGYAERELVEIRVYEIDGLNVRASGLFLPKEKLPGGDGLPAFKGNYIQLTPNGKIKYDPLFVQHPLWEVFPTFRNLVDSHNDLVELLKEKEPDQSRVEFVTKKWVGLYDELAQSGIPLFGLSKNRALTDQRDTLKKIRDWMEDDADKWDVSEPIIPLPESGMDRLVATVEEIKLKKLRR